MDFQSFKKTLKKCNLTIKEFAKICGLNPNSISTSWKSKNEVPQWVDSWLQNYIKAKTLDNVKDVVCDDEDKASNTSTDKSSPANKNDK
ncbi:hypothetical protein [Nitrosophilus kaiyonis]|uniref:hypothetical protein n=1 Tax=Nitrosophilus kaiyonis TaxID=2930200 RepID=UPI00249198A2|nr:hypothetical protein [Nitrosophilus kaiyonis]